MLLTIGALIIVLSVLILVHEFGHFFAAKAVGIQVPRFSLGFGKRLWGFYWGETEFVLSAIPLGGYVKMAGMEDDEAAEALEGAGPAEEVDPERTFDAKPLWARTLVITAGVIMNFLFAAFAFALIGLLYGETRIPTTRVSGPAERAPVEAAAEVRKIPAGARITAIGGRAVEDWDGVVRALLQAPAGPVELRLDGQAPVTLTLPDDPERRGALVGSINPLFDPVITQIEGGSPAAKAGLQRGDRVLEAAGQPVGDWSELVSAIRARPGQVLPLVVLRDGRRIPVTVQLASVKQSQDGRTVEVGRIGAGALQHRSMGPVGAIGFGFRQTWETTKLLLRTLKQLVTGELSARNMGGLLTIGQASGDSARAGLESFLSFLALFSVNLAVLNLLPIPILDGGHLMFLAIEAVRGRPLSIETRIRLSQLGLVIVVGLMLWANGNDVVRLLERYFGR